MRVYLDTCSLERPWDIKSHARIYLEAEAILAVLTWCAEGQGTLIASEVLQFEIERIRDPLRITHAFEALSKATHYIDATEAVIEKASHLRDSGISPLDALHLASAIEAGADFFCTCDDRLLRKAKHLVIEKTKVVSPLELIMELGL